MPRPRTYTDETRADLVRAAGRLLAERGPAGLSVRAVADAVGASTTAIYGLFGSKAGLVRGVFVAAFEHLAAELGSVPETDDPGADLLHLGLAYRRSAVDEPHLYAAMFGGPPDGVPPTPEDAAVAASTLEVLRGAVRRAQDAGYAAGRDLEDVTVGLWAQVHGLASLELAGALGDRGEPYWRDQLTALVRGLGTTPRDEVSGPG